MWRAASSALRGAVGTTVAAARASAAVNNAAHRGRGFAVRASPALGTAVPEVGATDSKLPSESRVVVVGGGVIGCSVAYHLAHLGCEVLVVERDQLTSGTTWHAAGLVNTFGSTSETSTELRRYTRDLYSRLEEETGQATGFMPVGFIELATSKDRLEEFRRVAAFNKMCGVEVEEISAREVEKMMPLCRVDDIEAGFYVAGDGRANPVDVTMALAKGARMQGAKIVQGVSVTGVTKENGRVTGVTTDAGDVKAEFVVNCAGMWARQFGALAGVNVPNQAAEHYYLITGPVEGVDPKWPVVEDPSSYTYIRPEGEGLMIGLFETEAAAWAVDEVPEDFSFAEISPDWERMMPFLEAAMGRVPASLEAGTKKFFCGPESFTPDRMPLVGESPELAGYFVAAGLNSIGILTGGGIGRLVAHWIMNGKPDMDVTGMNVDRLHPYQNNPEYRAARVVESLGMVYKPHYPTYSMQTARGIKRSAIYDRLADRRACFKDVSGWEGADWFAPEGVAPEQGKLSWGRHHWFDYWKAEHDACRNGVILMDMSFMSKFLVQGRDAGKVLNRLSTADVDGDVDTITYTQWLNDDGKMEADLTVTKMADDKFMVVATDTMHRHVEAWMNRNTPSDAHAVITDVTGAYAQINLQGPRSRELLQKLTTQDVSDEAFPFRTAREVDMGFARVTVARITYVGELGYELYVPSEMALHVYDRVVEAGEDVGLVHAGLRALGSLRMEKGYRDYGHDMDNTDTLLEVGLGFTADYEKEGGFIGKEAVLAQKEAAGGRPLPKRMLQVLVKDPEPLMHHAEVLLRDGVAVGEVRAASYGHSLGGAVGLSMVHADESKGERVSKKWIDAGKWEVDIAGTRYPAEVSIRPMYDPTNKRIRM